jgi:hypothetical protein
MAGLIKRLLGSGESAVTNPWPEARQWAEHAQHRFALGRGLEGFAVDVRSDGGDLRLEWAPSQRKYIAGQELRIRADIGQARGLQMMAATCELLRHLEREVFEQFTEGTETRIDDDTPEEMRWVVMYPQVPGKLLGPLHHRFGLLSDRPRASTLWLEHGLAAPLAASSGWHDATVPLVMVVQRGRFVLRMGLPQPRVAALEGALSLAIAAVAAARRVASEVDSGAVSSQRPSTWGPAPGAPAKAKEHDAH